MVSEHEMTAPPPPPPEYLRCEACGEKCESLIETFLGIALCNDCHRQAVKDEEDLEEDE